MQANLLSYALAIFQLADDKDKQNLYYQQIQQIDKLNHDNPEFAKVLSTVTIAKDERKELAQEVLKQLNIDQTVIYWVWTIIDNNQYSKFDLIKQNVMEVHHAIFNIIRVEVTSASELTRSQLSKITDFFSNKLKAQVDLKINIKPNLIGGLKIQLNNKTYNNTFKYKLEELKKALLSKKG